MNKTITLILALIVIIGAIFFIESRKPEQSNLEPVVADNIVPVKEKEATYPKAKEITTPDGFINVDEITVDELIGKKVILVDFWTYSCINCQRTLPYLNSWYDKYKDQGLEILAIHTPEFEFESEYENVLEAVKKFNIKYPVILDNDYSTWRAYENRYWPRKYIIDIDGYIVYDHIGEGAYRETEKKIQELLAERSAKLGTNESITSEVSDPEGAVDVSERDIGSPEVYFGSSRNEYLGNGAPLVAGNQSLEIDSDIKNLDVNTLYLEGSWDIQEEYARNSSSARILFNYRATDVHTVLGSSEGEVVRVYVKRDREYIGKDLAGKDIKFDGEKSYINVSSESLYNLIEGDDAVKYHTIELIIDSGSVEAFTFTFG